MATATGASSSSTLRAVTLDHNAVPAADDLRRLLLRLGRSTARHRGRYVVTWLVLVVPGWL